MHHLRISTPWEGSSNLGLVIWMLAWGSREAKIVRRSRDALVEFYERIERFFSHLAVYFVRKGNAGIFPLHISTTPARRPRRGVARQREYRPVAGARGGGTWVPVLAFYLQRARGWGLQRLSFDDSIHDMNFCTVSIVNLL
ncbi:hypothetical protein V8E53_008606 [Lactarius tabidus]